VRARLLRELPLALTYNQRRFLVSLSETQPEWSLLDVPHVSELPAVRWKLQNLQKLAAANPAKLREQRDELLRRLERLA
jgi:hypothetical protein